MAKQENKITEEQLKTLQQHVGKINQAQLQLGQAVSTKFDIIAALPSLRKELQEFQKELEEDYGKVNVNIQDGTYEDIPEQAEVVSDAPDTKD
jgi:exonuclease VII small subunit